MVFIPYSSRSGLVPTAQQVAVPDAQQVAASPAAPLTFDAQKYLDLYGQDEGFKSWLAQQRQFGGENEVWSNKRAEINSRPAELMQYEEFGSTTRKPVQDTWGEWSARVQGAQGDSTLDTNHPDWQHYQSLINGIQVTPEEVEEARKEYLQGKAREHFYDQGEKAGFTGAGLDPYYIPNYGTIDDKALFGNYGSFGTHGLQGEPIGPADEHRYAEVKPFFSRDSSYAKEYGDATEKAVRQLLAQYAPNADENKLKVAANKVYRDHVARFGVGYGVGSNPVVAAEEILNNYDPAAAQKFRESKDYGALNKWGLDLANASTDARNRQEDAEDAETLSDIVKVVGFASLAIPGLGQAIGAAAGATGAVAQQVVGSALLNGFTSFAASGGDLKAGLKGAVSGAAGAYLGNAAFDAAGGVNGGMVASAARGAASGATSGLINTGSLTGAAKGAVTGAAAGAAGNLAGGGEAGAVASKVVGDAVRNELREDKPTQKQRATTTQQTTTKTPTPEAPTPKVPVTPKTIRPVNPALFTMWAAA